MTDADTIEHHIPESDATALPEMNRQRVFGLALPIIGEQILHTLVVAVDTLLVARLGEEAIAGVGTAVEFIYFIIAILVALEIGTTVLVSQAFGAGLHDRVAWLSHQSLIWAVVLSVPVSIAGYFAAPHIIGIFGLEPQVAEYATTYLQITAATSIFLLLTFVCGAIFRGRGDGRTPLLAAVAANIVNVIASYLLIFGELGLPELGVAGSAWGAALARATSAAILLWLLTSGRRGIRLSGRRWLPEIDAARSLFRLGLPASIERILDSAGFVTMMAVVASIGTSALAAQQVVFTALAISFLPGFGFGLAATSLVGQSVGSGDLASAAQASRIAERWAIVWMGVGGIVYFAFAPQILGIFSDDPDVVDPGARAIRALAVVLPLWAIWSVYGGSLRGLGDTITPMISIVVTVWSSVFVAFLLVHFFDAGLGAVWLTFACITPFGAFFNRTRYWRRMASPRVGTEF